MPDEYSKERRQYGPNSTRQLGATSPMLIVYRNWWTLVRMYHSGVISWEYHIVQVRSSFEPCKRFRARHYRSVV